MYLVRCFLVSAKFWYSVEFLHTLMYHELAHHPSRRHHQGISSRGEDFYVPGVFCGIIYMHICSQRIADMEDEDVRQRWQQCGARFTKVQRLRRHRFSKAYNSSSKHWGSR